MIKSKGFLLLSFTVIVLFSCKKERGIEVKEADFYFSAIINGVEVKYEVYDTSDYKCFVTRSEHPIDAIDIDKIEGTSFLRASESQKGYIRIGILKYFDHYPNINERAKMIQKGPYVYAVGKRNSTTIDGADIEYYDAEGNMWFSGRGPQDGSTFMITELTDNTGGNFLKFFKATFNCRLYNINGDESIQLSEGTVKGKILFTE